jgi:hypothetical protein
MLSCVDGSLLVAFDFTHLAAFRMDFPGPHHQPSQGPFVPRETSNTNPNARPGKYPD